MHHINISILGSEWEAVIWVGPFVFVFHGLLRVEGYGTSLNSDK